MSPQETQVLQNFLDQLVKVQGVSKDAQAQSMINEAVSRQADASYLLVQRALLLEQALTSANNQIASLQADIRELQLQKTSSPASNFLDPAAHAWGNSTRSAALPVMPPPIPASYGAPQAATMAGTSSFGGFGNVLGTVAATAAGVAAGAFLFQGIEHLMGGSTHSQMLDNSASQLNQGSGDLLPGYFDHGNNAMPDTSQAANSFDTTDDFDDDSGDSDDPDLA